MVFDNGYLGICQLVQLLFILSVARSAGVFAGVSLVSQLVQLVSLIVA